MCSVVVVLLMISLCQPPTAADNVALPAFAAAAPLPLGVRAAAAVERYLLSSGRLAANPPLVAVPRWGRGGHSPLQIVVGPHI